jgi:hypothetical protein
VRWVDSPPTVLPMSDRRLLLAVSGVLVGALGVAIILLSLLALRHPVGSTGEIGTPTDLSVVLIDLVRLGGLLAVAGFGTAAALVRAQLHPRR